jgi:hypothetical protein
MKVIAHLDASPLFPMSKYAGTGTQAALVSLPVFATLGRFIGSVDEIPMTDFILKLKSGLSDAEIDEVIDEFTISYYANSVQVYDFRSGFCNRLIFLENLLNQLKNPT